MNYQYLYSYVHLYIKKCKQLKVGTRVEEQTEASVFVHKTGAFAANLLTACNISLLRCLINTYLVRRWSLGVVRVSARHIFIFGGVPKYLFYLARPLVL